MKVRSAITLTCLASILILDGVRAFPVPSATHEEDIVKVVTRRDESFLDPETIRVEDQVVPSFSLTLRGSDVPNIGYLEARSASREMDKIPNVPPTFALLLELEELIGLQIGRNTVLEHEVHEFDREPKVANFRLPPPPKDHPVVALGSNWSDRFVWKQRRTILGKYLKCHLLTLLRKARRPETVTVAQVKHARLRVMKLWVLITAEDLKLLGSQPYEQPLRGFVLARRDAADGVVRVESLDYSNEEKLVAREC
ncbi:hypothetical protein H0H93_013738, partial [Arthromyces matolae]